MLLTSLSQSQIAAKERNYVAPEHFIFKTQTSVRHEQLRCKGWAPRRGQPFSFPPLPLQRDTASNEAPLIYTLWSILLPFSRDMIRSSLSPSHLSHSRYPLARRTMTISGDVRRSSTLTAFCRLNDGRSRANHRPPPVRSHFPRECKDWARKAHS